MSVQIWADKSRSGRFHQDEEHQRAITAIESLLAGNSTPSEAATSVTRAYEPRLQNPKKASDYDMGTFWAIFSDAARTFGGSSVYSERLADLVIAISKLPDVLDKYGTPIHSTGTRRVYWRELPDFPLTFREYGIDFDQQEDDDPDGSRFLQSLPAFLNATTFAATLMMRSANGVGMDFHAVVAFANALEYELEPDCIVNTKWHLPAAATWILVAGSRLRQYCTKGVESHAMHGPLWHGGNVLNIERWKFWQERVDQLAESITFDQGTRHLAAEAAAQM